MLLQACGVHTAQFFLQIVDLVTKTGGQLELQINRDPNLQKERQKEQLSTRKQEQKRVEQNR